jgi:hypothetical protein
MTIGPRKARFYFGVLSVGFVTGGFLSALLERFLPEGPAKAFFTWTVAPSFGPINVDLLVLNMTVGPVGLRVSLLAIIGVVLAYLLARSLF